MRLSAKVLAGVAMVVVLGTLGRGAAQGQQAQQPAPQQPEQPCYRRLPVELVSLNLRDAHVQTTLRLLAQHYRVNMIVTDEVAGAVTLDFYRVPVRDVFQTIIEAAGLECIEQGQALRVSTAERIRKEEQQRAEVSVTAKTRAADLRKKEAEARMALREVEAKERDIEMARARGPVREALIKLYYSDAQQVAEMLKAILGIEKKAGTLEEVTRLASPTVAGVPPTVVTERRVVPPPPAARPFEAVPQEDVLALGLVVEAHKETNSVFIRYFESDLERIKTLIKEQLDVALPQIHIAAQMVITTQNALEQLGIEWGGAGIHQPVGGRSPALVASGFATGVAPVGGTGVQGTFTGNPNFTGTGLLPISPTTGFPVGGNIVNLPTFLLPTLATPGFGALFGIVGKEFNLNFAVQALETQGKARRLAEPKIVTVENRPAVIQRGFEVPFLSSSGLGGTNVQFKEALLHLKVTPNVIKDQAGETRIRLKVLIENNEPDFTRAIAGNPPIFRRKAENEVVIREGEKLVVGGVLTERNERTVRQVPLLGRIPVLGWLFKSREISGEMEDLIVIIAPSVIAPTAAAQR